MNDYGKNGILGAATMLPATSAFLVSDGAHPVVLAGFVGVSVVSMIITISYITRYLRNKSN